jgi:hypothetical protein
MEILIQKPWEYTFSKKDNGDLLLSVLCGSVGMFELDIILNQEETGEYNKEGETYIDQLAKQICYSPNDWRTRKIN